MTVNEWLALPDDKLGVALAKVLTPGPWKHDLVLHGSYSFTHWECRKCKQSFKTGQVKSANYTGSTGYDWCEGATKDPCPVPVPIDINDWNVAMGEYRKRGPQRVDIYLHRLWETLIRIPHEHKFLGCEVMEYDMWKDECAQPKHYLIAAAMCKENKP